MTEAEELTLQRFAAIMRGAAKDIPRFLAMREHIFTRLDPPPTSKCSRTSIAEPCRVRAR